MPHLDHTFQHLPVQSPVQSPAQSTTLEAQIASLQKQLDASVKREARLRTTNMQLTNMLISASQGSLKRSEQFVRLVQGIMAQPHKGEAVAKRQRRVESRERCVKTFANFQTEPGEENNHLLSNLIGRKELRKKIDRKP